MYDTGASFLFPGFTGGIRNPKPNNCVTLRDGNGIDKSTLRDPASLRAVMDPNAEATGVQRPYGAGMSPWLLAADFTPKLVKSQAVWEVSLADTLTPWCCVIC